eukprot:c20991_g1_i2.p1 GENE.c20991_g1_i2~~c20991_g1_i2.p1  ORF type:complete len:723 (-),score=334.28 c20991_g1_i2:10-2178(-)
MKLIVLFSCFLFFSVAVSQTDFIPRRQQHKRNEDPTRLFDENKIPSNLHHIASSNQHDKRDILSKIEAEDQLQVKSRSERRLTNLKSSFESCPNQCHMRGLCVDGECLCDFPYTGVDCSGITDACPGDCSQNGVCVSGECICDDEWEGLDCSKPKSCHQDCNGHGQCIRGKCECDAHYEGDYCDRFVSGCKKECLGRGRCEEGVCYCDEGWKGESCELENIGRNITLETSEILGWCSSLILPKNTCPSRFVRIRYEDSDLFSFAESARQEYEKLKNSCFSTNGQILLKQLLCAKNIPVFENKEEIKPCLDICDKVIEACDFPENSEFLAVKKRIPNFCGPKPCENTCNPKLSECPNNCSEKGKCLLSGKCQCNKPWIGESCSIQLCLNNCTNDKNGKCNFDKGVCNCYPPWSSDDCSIALCMNNCSGHGNCSQNSENPGNCKCEEKWGGVDCSYPVCLNDCSGNGKCTIDGCDCDESWKGTDCSIKECLHECSGRGECIKGECNCSYPYTGADCSLKKCKNDCSSHGECDLATGVCDCRFPFVANDDCSLAVCPKNCSGSNGICNERTGVCKCNKKWTGDDCAIPPTCTKDCSRQGRCNEDGICECDFPFIGEDCSIAQCPNNCSKHGTCNKIGVCICDKPFIGNDCSTGVCPSSCSGHGDCDTSTAECKCQEGWLLPACDSRTCPNNCSKNGVCNTKTGECTCNDSHYGEDCSKLLKKCPM